jgi:pimeloyl-ACP methyl ester carboxylesterase
MDEERADALAKEVYVPAGEALLAGELQLPTGATGLVLFAHGSGSGRHSPRNQYVAQVIREFGVGTLLFDLLTPEEKAIDQRTRHLRFDIGLLARRLAGASRWALQQAAERQLRLGYFGASTGGGAALAAAAELGASVGAVVSRGGRPDLAGAALPRVTAPTLLIVGALDEVVLQLNQEAYEQLRCEKQLQVVPGATHLFEEPGKLAEVAQLAAAWFQRHLSALSD